MKLHVRNYSWFYVPFAMVWIGCAFILAIHSKASVHLWINQYHAPFFDIFFKYVTNLGDGLAVLFFVVMALFKNFRMAILVVVVYLISGAAVQLLKHTLFWDALRPVAYLGSTVHLYLIDGVKMHLYHSFPSGHSASAFGYFLCMAFLSKNNIFQFFMFLMAALVAFSRVYLSQHFLFDIFWGSFIGVITSLLCYWWMAAYKAGWLDKNIGNYWSKK